jgi:hypothetical protein
MRPQDGTGRVVQSEHANRKAAGGMPPLEDLAATLRDHLWRAGVRRAELHEERPTTKRVTFYDLRATGITWEALANTPHLAIQQRAGHKNFSTTQGYIRAAEAVGINVGAPFPPLPAELTGDVGDAEAAGSESPSESKSESEDPGDDTIEHQTSSKVSASPTGFESADTVASAPDCPSDAAISEGAPDARRQPPGGDDAITATRGQNDDELREAIKRALDEGRIDDAHALLARLARGARPSKLRRVK